MNRLKDKVAIVTGAAGGIGEATAKLFAEEGAQVVASDINYALLESWVTDAVNSGLQIIAFKHDVTSADDWQAVVAATLAAYGRLDILVNNAGVYPAGATMENTSADDWNRVIAINLTGSFIGSQACLPPIKVNGGSIVNIASIAGIVGGNGPAYSASKGGLRLLTKDMAIELAKYNIRVNSIHPGGVKTPMTQPLLAMPGMDEAIKNICPQGRMADAIEIAYGALYLASAESSYVTGEELVIDGGLVTR